MSRMNLITELQSEIEQTQFISQAREGASFDNTSKSYYIKIVYLWGSENHLRSKIRNTRELVNKLLVQEIIGLTY